MTRECLDCQRSSSNTSASKNRMLVSTEASEKSCDSLLVLWQMQMKCFIFPNLPLIWSRTTISRMCQCIVYWPYFWHMYSGIIKSKVLFVCLIYTHEKCNIQRAPGNWPLALESQVINHSFQTCLWELSVLGYCNLCALQYPWKPQGALQASSQVRLANTNLKCHLSVQFTWDINIHNCPRQPFQGMPSSPGLVTDARPSCSLATSKNFCCISSHWVLLVMTFEVFWFNL